VILLANKFDYGVAGDSAEENLLEFASLGFGDPVPFSSIHGTGIGELYNNMVMSMTSVLKQWDAYQRRITAMQVQIREEQRAAAVALLAGEDGVAADADRNSRRIRTGLKVVRSSLRPSKKSEIEEMEASSKAIAAEIAEEQARIVAEAEAEEATLKVENDEGKERVRVVVAGKPNVGKSTLINGLLGQDRLLTGPQAGITRDSIAIKWRLAKHPDHIFELVDTAGIRGVTELAHSRFDRVDSMAMNTTVRAISYSNVVVLVLDVVDGLYGYTGVDPVFAGQIHKNFIDSINPGASASRDRMMKAREQKGGHKGRRAQKYDAMKELTTRRNPDKQAYQDKLSMLVARVAGAVTKHDMDVARLAAEHGKALVVLANKVDLLKGGAAEVRSVLKGLETLFTFSLAQNKGVTVLPVSALTQSNLDTLPDRIVSIYDKWNTRINTGLLNRWLRALTVLRPPPSIGGKKTNLKYATQTNIRPPTFAIFASRKTDFPEEYVNFLTNSLREEFGFHGIPIRVHIRTGDNPYMENRVLSMSEKRAIARRRIRERVDEKKSHRSTQKRVPSNRLR
jgi:predicted GTPase